ncbi:MAG: single-stranded DNA-binding protein [Candidatus Sulfotelmatobacter sp.]
MPVTEAQHKNEVHLAGELAKDPVIRATASGQKVATLTVATKYKERTEYHRVVCWDAVADKAEKCSKGAFVKVVGRLQNRSWEDKQTGQKKYSTEVVAFQLAIPAQELPPLTPDAIKSGTDIARAILRPAKESSGDEDCPF